jgi:GntR family transcriptional regulator, histidine utilization repressor
VSALRKLTLHIGASIADAALADEMRVRAGSPVFHSRVLPLENNEPVQLEEGWVDPAVAPEYGLKDFAITTPSQYLVRVAPFQRVEYRIEAAPPGADARAARDGRERALYRASSAIGIRGRTG